MTTAPEDPHDSDPLSEGQRSNPVPGESPTPPANSEPVGSYPGQGNQPQPGYQAQGPDENLQRIQLNGWLSAFFGIIPALIFFIIDKERTNPIVRDFHRDTLNFSIIRAIIGLLALLPVIGWVIGLLGGIACFVVAIMAAINAPNEYQARRSYKYPFNFTFVS
ncbi:DUF4870 domain-containing protein [Glutamicibacter arilaitensis]|uniref:DUF4870 domain-containing protein n=1 Tax=Glutamicibacter arilaitensis TaxID=256701 RepID=UPI003850DE5E